MTAGSPFISPNPSVGARLQIQQDDDVVGRTRRRCNYPLMETSVADVHSFRIDVVEIPFAVCGP
jgi:hypothetical protein